MPKNNKKTIKISVKNKALKPKKKIEKKPLKKNKKKSELLEVSKNWRKKNLEENNNLSKKEKQEIKETYGQGFYQPEEDYEKNDDHEGDKKLMMWAGVTFFMTVILFFWILNIKNILKTDSIEKDGEFEWTEVKSEIDDIMGDIKENIDNIEFEAEEEAVVKEESELNNDISEETIIDLKNKIKELETKMNQE
jgi:Fe2+ transport system protein B